MDIFIPSKGRANAVRTLNQIPAHLKPKVVVYPDEADRYRFYLRDRAEVVTCDCEKGITHKRNWIGRNAGSKFVMLDDDLKFFVREQEGGKKLRDATKADMETMFSALDNYLSTFGHVGVIDRVASSMIKPEEMVFGNLQKNTRMMRVLGYQRKVWELAEHGRIPLMEDFDLTLQLIRRGWPNAVLSWWAQDQGSTQASGGCSTYRTHELHEQSAKLLAELHSPFVKLRQKENKTGGAFGHRTEVTIQWKKAAEAGRFYPDTPPPLGRRCGSLPHSAPSANQLTLPCSPTGESFAMSMKNAVAIVREAGYELEQVPELKGATWKQLVHSCPDKKTRDYLQSLRWTGGDVKKLYAAREKQRETYARKK